MRNSMKSLSFYFIYYQIIYLKLYEAYTNMLKLNIFLNSL